ncbi:unnamed protein product [Closterium sp. Naga37s-1]|nr:unnamed protein product [Closterium sp. Naga37s-1]
MLASFDGGDKTGSWRLAAADPKLEAEEEEEEEEEEAEEEAEADAEAEAMHHVQLSPFLPPYSLSLLTPRSKRREGSGMTHGVHPACPADLATPSRAKRARLALHSPVPPPLYTPYELLLGVPPMGVLCCWGDHDGRSSALHPPSPLSRCPPLLATRSSTPAAAALPRGPPQVTDRQQPVIGNRSEQRQESDRRLWCFSGGNRKEASMGATLNGIQAFVSRLVVPRSRGNAREERQPGLQVKAIHLRSTAATAVVEMTPQEAREGLQAREG